MAQSKQIGQLMTRDYKEQPLAEVVRAGVAALKRKGLGKPVAVHIASNWPATETCEGLPVSYAALPAGHVLVIADMTEVLFTPIPEGIPEPAGPVYQATLNF